MFTFDQIFIKRSYYREKHLNAPLLEERISYLQYWSERTKSQHSLRSIAQYLLRIVEFLHLENLGIVTLCQIEKSATDWAKYQYNHPQKRSSFSKTGEKRFIWFAKDWLKKLNRMEPLPEERTPLFNKIFERHKALLHHIEAPLLKERLKYLQYWADSGAKESFLRRIAQYLLIIMDHLIFFKVRMVSVNEIANAAEKWATNKAIRRRRGDYSKFAKARFIRDAINWFEMLGCLKKQDEPHIPFKEHLERYNDYMLREQGLSVNTISGRSLPLKDLLKKINEKKKHSKLFHHWILMKCWQKNTTLMATQEEVSRITLPW